MSPTQINKEEQEKILRGYWDEAKVLIEQDMATLSKMRSMVPHGKLKRSPYNFLVENAMWHPSTLYEHYIRISLGTSTLPRTTRNFIADICARALIRVVIKEEAKAKEEGAQDVQR